MRMKPRLGTVILLLSMVCGTASARTGVIDIADYKGRYDTQDMTPFVYTLLESLPADKPVKLVFPQGTYHSGRNSPPENTTASPTTTTDTGISHSR